MTDKSKDNMSLDDILSSIRSSVEDIEVKDKLNSEEPKVLSEITDMGDENATPPMVNGHSAFNVEESIQSILEILENNKEQLPREFLDRQDEFIKSWLNTHLPEIVANTVQKEINRMFQYVYNQK